MKDEIDTFFQETDLEQSVIIGFYGGGNFGDELLLENLLNVFSAKGYKDLQFYYQNAVPYDAFHHDFGYKILDARDKVGFFKNSLQSRNVIVGGGGLWGLDVNIRILLMSILLLAYRYAFRKNVYLLGVGYYNSTGKLGRVSAFLAAKAAHKIIARDKESYENFLSFSRDVSLGNDIAWRLPKLKLTAYKDDFAALDRQLVVAGKTLFITLRRFQPNQKNTYTRLIETYLANNREKPVIIALMEPRDVDAEGYERVRDWQRQHKNVQVIDFSYNPFALFMFFVRHHKNLAVIAPQFHTILTAYLAKVPFLPLSYDNKVADLLKQLGRSSHIAIDQLQIRHLQTFTDAFYQDAKGP